MTDWIPEAIDIRTDAVILLGQRVGGGPAGDGRVVHPDAEVEERDAGVQDGLGLLAGKEPAVRGGCGTCRNDCWFHSML